MTISKYTFFMAMAVASLTMTAVGAEDLSDTVATKLRDSGAMAGYRVNVKSKAGTVWLEGQVSDQKQLAAAVSIAENIEGVERVVNRLSISNQPSANLAHAFGLPQSVRSLIGLPTAVASPPTLQDKPLAAQADGDQAPENEPSPLVVDQSLEKNSAPIQLTQAVLPVPRDWSQPAVGKTKTNAAKRADPPRPLGIAAARPMPRSKTVSRSQEADPRGRSIPMTATRTSAINDPMQLPPPVGYEGKRVANGQVSDGQIVPGSMRMTEGPRDDGYAGGAAQVMNNAPLPIGGTGVGMPPVPMRADGPNMPKYSWPSYAAYPNYAAVQYPTQYSPTAWPYIGPFYPYPQVPLGWRRVSLEWDDGWWFLDFDDRHQHSHHR